MIIGRNDPCPCGSGKKYKKCCMPRAEVISLQAYREAQTYRRLLADLGRHLSDADQGEEIGTALSRFMGSPDPLEDLSDEEAEAAEDWIAFAYQSSVDGLTACQRLAAQAEELDPGAREMLQSWTAAAPGFFRVTQVEPQIVYLSRLPDGRTYQVTADGTGLRVGELIETWLLPVPSGWRFGFERQVHPSDIPGLLTHLLEVELTLLRRQEPEATWDDLYRQCWPRLSDAATWAVVHGESVYQIQVPPGPAVLDGGVGLNDSKWNTVARLLTTQLEAEQMHPDQVRGALRLCRDVASTLGPRSGKPEGWAAGLYYLFRLDIHFGDLTQADAGDLFGVSGGTTGTRAREVVDALGVLPLDIRYVDLLDPFVRSLWRFEAIQAMEGDAVAASRP